VCLGLELLAEFTHIQLHNSTKLFSREMVLVYIPTTLCKSFGCFMSLLVLITPECFLFVCLFLDYVPSDFSSFANLIAMNCYLVRF
jgi:hypothetical protein